MGFVVLQTADFLVLIICFEVVHLTPGLLGLGGRLCLVDDRRTFLQPFVPCRRT